MSGTTLLALALRIRQVFYPSTPVRLRSPSLRVPCGTRPPDHLGMPLTTHRSESNLIAPVFVLGESRERYDPRRC